MAVPQSSRSAATTARADGSAAGGEQLGQHGTERVQRRDAVARVAEQLDDGPAVVEPGEERLGHRRLADAAGPVTTTGHNRVVACSAMATSSLRASSRSTRPARRAGRPTRSAAGGPTTSAADRSPPGRGVPARRVHARLRPWPRRGAPRRRRPRSAGASRRAAAPRRSCSARPCRPGCGPRRPRRRCRRRRGRRSGRRRRPPGRGPPARRAPPARPSAPPRGIRSTPTARHRCRRG